MSIKITGTGSYIPLLTKKNDDFLNAKFLKLQVLKRGDMPKIITILQI